VPAKVIIVVDRQQIVVPRIDVEYEKLDVGQLVQLLDEGRKFVEALLRLIPLEAPAPELRIKLEYWFSLIIILIDCMEQHLLIPSKAKHSLNFFCLNFL